MPPPTQPPRLSRRGFLQSSTATALLTALPAAARAPADSATVQKLIDGWSFRRGPLTPEAARTGSGGWQPVTLPHCTNAGDACDPDVPYFQGQSWYRLPLHLSNPHADGHTLLRFRGAGQTTTVWAGGIQLARHVGGYDEFVVDLSGQHGGQSSQPGSTLDLLVCCDSTPDQDRSPSNLSDFCLYGGLYRHVELIYLPALALDNLQIDPVLGPDGPATVRIAGSLLGTARHPGASVTVEVELFDPTGSRVSSASRQLPVWTGMQELATLAVNRPSRWSPETPHLYTCRVTLRQGLEQSSAGERFGLRHIDFPEHGLFHLNGAPLFLRGTQRHQDHAGVAGAQDDDSVRQELTLIRDMGANFIRLGHYQQDRLVLDLCDELGILVWEEVPWCRAGVGSEAWKDSTRAQMRHMVQQHRNHPSVVFWGLGNEDDWPGEYPTVDQTAIRAFMTELRDLAHSLDPQRLTSYRRCDFARDIPDVYSPSIWAGWYNGAYTEYGKSITAGMGTAKRFLHIEWGADSHAGRHSEDPYAALGAVTLGTGTEERAGDYLRTGGAVRVSRDGDWSESYACDLFDWYLKTQEALPGLAGSAQWVFKDFASPLRADSPVPRVNQKGVVARDLTPKESYAVFQSYWSRKPMVHILGHTWPRRWGQAGQKRTVKVYSNCPEVELFLNGASLGRRTRDAQNFPAANLRWEVAFRAGSNTLRAVGYGAATVEDQIQLEYHTQPWGKPAMLRLLPAAGTGTARRFEVEVRDSAGALCLDSRTQVRFQTAGDLRLIDNLGTVGGSRVVEVANGVASISLYRDTPGTLSVAAKGLGTAQLQI